MEADDLRKTQEALKTQVKALEESLKAPAKTGFLQAEMREMLQNLVLQNKRLSEKLDYLINLLVEAASAEESDVYEKTLSALAKAQVEVLDQLSTLKQRVEEVGKAEAAAEEKDVQHGRALEAEVHAASALAEEKFRQLAETVSKLSVSKQLEVLSADLKALQAQVSSLEREAAAVPAVFEESLNALKAGVANAQSEISALASVVKEVRQEEKQLFELEVGLKKLESELAEKTIRAYTGGLPDEDRHRLEDLAAKVLAVSSEVTRLEQALQALPAGEAQQFSAVARRLEQIEADLKKIEELEAAADFQKAVLQQLSEFRARLDGLAATVEKVEKAVEKPEDPLEAFITKLPAGKPVTLSETASALSLSEQDLLYKLVFLEKTKPGLFKLYNTSFFAKASRKKPFLVRL